MTQNFVRALLIASFSTTSLAFAAAPITSADVAPAVKKNPEIQKIVKAIITYRKLPCAVNTDSANYIPSQSGDEADTFSIDYGCSQPGNVQELTIKGEIYRDSNNVVQVLMSDLHMMGAE
jgi:hypothetical protein